jgi:putative ABC transport system substrate-binding protein
MEVADLDPTFAAMQRDGVQAVLVQSAAWMIPWLSRIAFAARDQRLPLISDWNQLTRAGGLLSYRWDDNQQLVRAAAMVDRILKGADPAAVPTERATTFRLVVNLKTAKALGITIPPSVLARADEVIQ